MLDLHNLILKKLYLFIYLFLSKMARYICIIKICDINNKHVMS